MTRYRMDDGWVVDTDLAVLGSGIRFSALALARRPTTVDKIKQRQEERELR
jgi:hypothetical protein